MYWSIENKPTHILYKSKDTLLHSIETVETICFKVAWTNLLDIKVQINHSPHSWVILSSRQFTKAELFSGFGDICQSHFQVLAKCVSSLKGFHTARTFHFVWRHIHGFAIRPHAYLSATYLTWHISTKVNDLVNLINTQNKQLCRIRQQEYVCINLCWHRGQIQCLPQWKVCVSTCQPVLLGASWGGRLVWKFHNWPLPYSHLVPAIGWC